MNAIILAAGLGTRLKPLTDKIPKALVEVNGKPMLERVIESLKSQGFNNLVVNVHHFADQIKDFLSNKDFMVKIEISDETLELKDTGGGIIQAGSLIFKESDSPVLIHNVDILSNADLKELMSKAYLKGGAVLLVSDRESSRKLIFDKLLNLKGWHDLINNQYKPAGLTIEEGDRELAFSGIYALGKEAVEEMQQLLGTGKYPVMDYFLNMERRQKVTGVIQKDLRILDIGKPATLLQAEDLFRDKN